MLTDDELAYIEGLLRTLYEVHKEERCKVLADKIAEILLSS